jgi:hypothetical protein
MTWNYRIIRYTNGGFVLHDVYYEDDKPISMGKQPSWFAADSVEELQEDLRLALRDATERPILDESEINSGAVPE